MPRSGGTFVKGKRHAGAGRKKGVPNRRTVLLHAFIEGIVNSENMRDKLVQEMSALKGEKFVKAFTDLVEFVQPKLARTFISGDPNAPVQHIITLDIADNHNDHLELEEFTDTANDAANRKET